ncbi:hypothetical protein ADN00_00340 [Ornatilinea apprima]|uniref:Major facilitator superfamily (MFS) profile domain-containing protein n=1 Tax=Ornatilinea apprima TaxID=1134406 RepID=A0A0P6XMF3_9CHLR|nr:MFS transporter [Ornatilinea apprima]KPL81028.1 hypothetical protein ADN00_00340 [Ornatilinea apprima]
MERPLRWFDTITINIYFLGLSALSQTMAPLILPLLVQQFVGENLKGTYYGNLRLWSLMMALLVQSLMGMLSDRHQSKYGKRRPFIFIGTLGVILVVLLIGFVAGMEGLTGYWVLFGLVILQQVGANTGHGAVQGLIPDLVPENMRGRYSAIKAILEVPLPVILVSMTIGKLVGAGNLWAGLFVLIAILLVAMIIAMFAPEKSSLDSNALSLDWKPFLRLVSMTALFTAIILGMGELIKWLSAFLAFTSDFLNLATISVVGFLAMALAIAVGVSASTRLGIGDANAHKSAFNWWVINRLAFLVGSTGMVSFMVYFLQGKFGFVAEQAAAPAAQLTMIVGVFILLSALPSGWLTDRFGSRKIVAAAGLMAALGTVLVIFAPDLTTVFIGGSFIGIGTGFFYSANWALGTEIAPKEEAGRYLGISNLAGAGAGAVGAYIGGPIADYFTVLVPQTPGLGYVALFAIYGILFLLSVACLRSVKQA